MSQRPLALTLVASLTFVPTLARADILADAADCIATLSQFNEDRPWAQLTIDETGVVALVESAREDAVYVEVGCRYGGDIYEGRRLETPPRMRVSGTPGLPRDRFDARHLADVVDAAQLGDATWSSITITALPGSSDDPVTTVVFDDGASVNLDPDLEGTATRAPRPNELKEAAAAAPTGARFEGTFLENAEAALAYLEGAMGTQPIRRIVLQPQMAMVAYGDPPMMRNWFAHGGTLTPDEPAPAEAAGGKRCASQPTIAAARASLARHLRDAAKARDVKRGIMLLLECDADGQPMRWQLLGGDGVLKEGQPLKQDFFPL